MTEIVGQVLAFVGEDPEINATWVLRFTSIQFGIAFFTSITRTESNAALALLGLYSAYGRKKEATKLYFVFLLLSIVTDFIWMIMYGNQIAGAETQEVQNEWQDYAFPPIGTAKFVLGMSVISFVVKIMSTPFVYKLYTNLVGDEDHIMSARNAYGSSSSGTRPSFVVGGVGSYQATGDTGS
eukprot:CAMPEP_0169443148 /NCGR_PEP_ID=MMETSP1042-20121227/9204_1 /TAXON_ID=464988 /ORGANISM="Hemiselmis andersenii, Strain CCMP1180" /LENGTH=181 /DNA_ID=CAMNT_0009554363 /DNA_START=17 /DNA_END=559 /DNA_ORIENTATION=+